jgi:hypothetical protein
MLEALLQATSRIAALEARADASEQECERLRCYVGDLALELKRQDAVTQECEREIER